MEPTGNRWAVLSGSWLKVLAMLTMLIDHLGAFYFIYDPQFFQPLFTIGHHHVTLYFLARLVGRMAFPIFAFLIVEGFLHTHDRVKYGRNLLLFAFLSEVPWNLVHSGTWHYGSQNVMFTLFLGYLGLCAIEYYRNDIRRQVFALLLLLVLSVLLRSDYGCSGYGFILMLYALRHRPLLQAVVGSCMLGGRWMVAPAFIPINMYNGQRGFIQGSVSKYLFYLFYPVHLFLIYLLQLTI